jgi:hypothetical protein
MLLLRMPSGRRDRCVGSCDVVVGQERIAFNRSAQVPTASPLQFPGLVAGGRNSGRSRESCIRAGDPGLYDSLDFAGRTMARAAAAGVGILAAPGCNARLVGADRRFRKAPQRK